MTRGTPLSGRLYAPDRAEFGVDRRVRAQASPRAATSERRGYIFAIIDVHQLTSPALGLGGGWACR
jgi:hypothetical protein